MDKDTAIDAVLQEHYQAMEEELKTMEEQYQEATVHVENNKKLVEETQQENARLKAELESVRSERRQLEVELAKARDENGGPAWGAATMNTEVSMQIKELSERLTEALTQREIPAEDRLTFQKDIDMLKGRVEVKSNELKETLAELEESRKHTAIWKERYQNARTEVEDLRRQFEHKFEQWSHTETNLTNQLNRKDQQIDRLKVALDKKQEEYKITQGVLQDTSKAFGECIAAYKSERKRERNSKSSAQEPSKGRTERKETRIRRRRLGNRLPDTFEIQHEPQVEGEPQEQQQQQNQAGPSLEPQPEAEHQGARGVAHKDDVVETTESESEAEPAAIDDDSLHLFTPMNLAHIGLPEHESPLGEDSVLPPMMNLQFPQNMTFQDLKRKCVEMAAKYNDQIRARMMENANKEKLSNAHKQTLTERRVLKFELSELAKICKRRAREIDELQGQVDQQMDTIEKCKEERENFCLEMRALQKANASAAAQTKFLLKRIESTERVLKGAEGARLLQPNPESDQPQPTCAHDIVELNMQLTRQKNRMELKVKELKEKLEASQQKKHQEEEMTPAYDEQNDGETQKRISADQPGPSKKKQKMQESSSGAKSRQVVYSGDGDSVWKKKWENAQAEFSAAKAVQAQIKTELKQQLERTQTQNELYQKDLKDLDHNLVEYQSKYNSLLELHKTLKDQFKSQMQGARVRIKELETVIAAMSREAEVAKEKMNKQEATHQLDVEKLKKEKKLFTDLQNRMMQMEQCHVDEIDQLKAQYSAQLAEGSKRVETPAEQEKGSDVEELVNTMRHLEMQLQTKDDVITELTERLHTCGRVLEKEAFDELQLKLQQAERQVREQEMQLKAAEKSLSEKKEECEKQMQSAKEEHVNVIAEMHATIATLETERDAVNLEVLKWKGQCQESEAQGKSMQKQMEGLDLKQREMVQDLEAKLEKAESENQELRTQIATKIAEVDDYIGEIKTWRQKLQRKIEENKTLKERIEVLIRQEENSPHLVQQQQLQDPPASTTTVHLPAQSQAPQQMHIQSLTVKDTGKASPVPSLEKEKTEKTAVAEGPKPSGSGTADENPQYTTEEFDKILSGLKDRPLPGQQQGTQEKDINELLGRARQACKGPNRKPLSFQHSARQYAHPISSRSRTSRCFPGLNGVFSGLMDPPIPPTETQTPAFREPKDTQDAAANTSASTSSGAEGSEKSEKPKKWIKIEYTLDSRKDDRSDDKKDRNPKQ